MPGSELNDLHASCHVIFTPPPEAGTDNPHCKDENSGESRSVLLALSGMARS